MGRMPGRLGRVLLGAVLATLVAWSPAAVVEPVAAAGPLRVEAETTYTVDPDAGRVRVAIEYTLTNNKPSTATVLYFYRELTFGIQPDARAIRATDGLGTLAVATRAREDHTEVEVRLRAPLYYRRTTTFTLRYDLVGGAPRSEVPLRVGKAFVTFGVWAFGDDGLGSVEVRLPPGFVSSVEGDDLPRASGGVGTGFVLRAEPREPNAFFAIVTADNRPRYEQSRLTLPGGIQIVIHAWPEDDDWTDSVSRTMEQGIPELQELIGVDWPVFRDLIVTERYTPALEGYAGFFLTDRQTIDISEDLDPLTTLHEASHVWFNQAMFTERWITEGLAEEYSYRAHTAIGGGPYDPPTRPDPDGPGFVRLNSWVFPTVQRDDTEDREIYGYQASAWLMHAIVREAGVEQMREAFVRADGNLTAYGGAGEPEGVGIRDDWRRFLDLTQPIEEPDPTVILEAVRELVIGPSEETVLRLRGEAREAYRALLEAGDGWLPPWSVRRPMGEWLFAPARERMAEANAVLVLRDQVEAAAAAEGLTLGDELRRAYEDADGDLADAKALAERQLAALVALAGARTALDAEPDLVTSIGLLGAEPRVSYDAARAAFLAGDLEAARVQGGAAADVIARAPGLGQERILATAAIGVTILILLAGAALLLRRRRRRGAMAAQAGAAALLALDSRFAPAPDAAPAPAEATIASGTLGADPDVATPPPGAGPPDDEGGPART